MEPEDYPKIRNILVKYKLHVEDRKRFTGKEIYTLIKNNKKIGPEFPTQESLYNWLLKNYEIKPQTNALMEFLK